MTRGQVVRVVRVPERLTGDPTVQVGSRGWVLRVRHEGTGTRVLVRIKLRGDPIDFAVDEIVAVTAP